VVHCVWLCTWEIALYCLRNVFVRQGLFPFYSYFFCVIVYPCYWFLLSLLFWYYVCSHNQNPCKHVMSLLLAIYAYWNHHSDQDPPSIFVRKGRQPWRNSPPWVQELFDCKTWPQTIAYIYIYGIYSPTKTTLCYYQG